ncbi:MAG: flotillin family protein [Deltaproteobacteria bacterium]|nr:flotillin family protein [Deltaproteobacteria bacterium]MBN2672799.1 flotillin family protein [Deltaproteobacteria bacterium]
MVPIVVGALILIPAGIIVVILKWYHKVEQGTALVRNGMGGTKVSFAGMLVIPIVHRKEMLDISVKRIEIDRMGVNGLICKDNMRADVKVAFFVQVNKTPQDTLKVAQSLGCVRASSTAALVEFFDAKFSEALKTVGKQFDFVELYTNRLRFKEEILKVIGTDLNGYVLDDAAIDYLEQTSIKHLDPKNILDADGIKKITDLTAKQAVLSNEIEQEKNKTIRKQDVEAREAILQLDKQQAEAEQNQKREISEITSRQEAAAFIVKQEERKRAEQQRIATEEEVAVAEENKLRQIVIASKNKERAAAVETERVEKDRQLEATERERIVTLAQIEKEKAVETERRNIQEVIRERVSVERSVVEQEERIKDTKDFAQAERSKKVAILAAEEAAEQAKIQEVKKAEAKKEASALAAEEMIIKAEGERAASEKEADARKIIADAQAQEEAVKGMGEARATEAKAEATEKYGIAEASVIEKKATAEAMGLKAKAEAVEKEGLAEARVMEEKFRVEAAGAEQKFTAEAVGIEKKATAEAKGIESKAEAMKQYDAVGKEHEEFKLRLQKDLDVELANIDIQAKIAAQQAQIVGEALRHARIDIVGGESQFFDKIVNSITAGKVIDRTVGNSNVLGDVRHALLGDKTTLLVEKIKNFADELGMDSNSVKNLSVAALLGKLVTMTDNSDMVATLGKLSESAKELGIAGENAASLMNKTK